MLGRKTSTYLYSDKFEENSATQSSLEEINNKLLMP